jgi:HD-like signal output (HDOD) protein
MRDIRDEIKNINDIVPIPATVSRIMSKSLGGESATESLIKLIESDGVLTSLILRSVNSAFYGFRSGVSTISHAVMLLGSTEINRLVLMYDMKQRLFALNNEQRDYLNRLWIHGISTATASRVIANHIGFSTQGEEFTAGLLHDMGKVVLVQHYSNALTKTEQMINDLGMTDIEAELQFFAIAHDEIGGILAENWNLPKILIDVMRYHHSVHLAGEHIEITAIVRLADLLCERWGVGIGEQDSAYGINDDQSWLELLIHFPHIAEQSFDEFEENIRKEFENNQGFAKMFT